MGEMKARPEKRLPLKMAFPKVAAAPQQSVAEAIKKYPRHGWDGSAGGRGMAALACLFCKHLVQLLGIKADHDFIANHNCRRRAAVVGTNQLEHSFLVRTHVLYLEINPFLRKVGFSP
jgi:hypothetical protein